MDDEMREVIDEFLVESNENLDQLDRDFVTLERAPGDLAVLASVFRTTTRSRERPASWRSRISRPSPTRARTC